MEDDRGAPLRRVGIQMNPSSNQLIRQSHRWLSIVFTLTVIANFVAMVRGQPAAWVTYSPLPPLAFLLFTGLYLFALPHINTWRGRSRTVRTDG